jgi:hypothetical protein
MRLNDGKTVLAQEIMRVGSGVLCTVRDSDYSMWFDAGDFDGAPEPDRFASIADSPALRVPAPISSEFALDAAVQKLNEPKVLTGKQAERALDSMMSMEVLGREAEQGEANGESKEAVSIVEGEDQDSGAGTSDLGIEAKSR